MPHLDKEFWFTQSFVCEAVGITLPALKNWQIPIKERVGRGGKIDLRDVFAYCRGKGKPHQRKMSGDSGDPNQLSAKERADLALAKKREAELALLERELVEAKDVQQAWENQMVALKQAVMTMPVRLARIYNTVDTAKEFKVEAMDECRSALENLSAIDFESIGMVDEEEVDA